MSYRIFALVPAVVALAPFAVPSIWALLLIAGLFGFDPVTAGPCPPGDGGC